MCKVSLAVMARLLIDPYGSRKEGNIILFPASGRFPAIGSTALCRILFVHCKGEENLAGDMIRWVYWCVGVRISEGWKWLPRRSTVPWASSD